MKKKNRSGAGNDSQQYEYGAEGTPENVTGTLLTMKKILLNILLATSLLASVAFTCQPNTSLIPYQNGSNVISMAFADTCQVADYYVLETAFYKSRPKRIQFSGSQIVPRILSPATLGMNERGVGYWEVYAPANGYYYFRLTPWKDGAPIAAYVDYNVREVHFRR